MAEYYALLARAVGALQRNDEASRREIYVKARSALIRQLKAITPPLPPSEISKQRLALEEAIRRVNREAAEAAAAAMLSEEEIARRAEQALAEALAPGAIDEAVPVDDEAETAAPPRFEPRNEGATFRPMPEPEVMEPEPVAPAEPAAEEPYAEVVRPRPAARPAQSAPSWERATTVTDVEEAPPPPPPPPSQPRAQRARTPDPRRGGRGWERASRRQKRRMSAGARVSILALVLILIAAGGYFAYEYRDDISDFVNSITGGDTTEVAEDTGDEATGDAAVSADAADAADTAVVDEEPVVLGPATAYYYDEPSAGSPSAPRHDATIVWGLTTDQNTGLDIITANITVPDEGLQIAMRISKSDDPAFSHEISVLVSQDAAHDDDPLAGVENFAAKSTEEAIGAALEGEAFNDPDFYLLQLPISDQLLNANRFNLSPWFDLNLVFESGRRAIVSFSKGEEGTPIFDQALAAWAN